MKEADDDREYTLSLIENSISVISKSQEEFFDIKGKLITLSEIKKVIILGDLHGDLHTFNKILTETNFLTLVEKNPNTYLVCLGDYIDRGPSQFELLQKLLNLLITYPKNIILLRGNHEGPRDLPVKPHDFPGVLKSRFGKEWQLVYEAYSNFFNVLYTACLFSNKALLLHGSVPFNVDSLNQIAWAHKTHPNTTFLTEILWSDPTLLRNVNYSNQGARKKISVDVICEFLDKINVSTLIRGHQCFKPGFHFHGNRILTLFSCKIPEYENCKSAYLNINFSDNYHSLKKNIFQV